MLHRDSRDRQPVLVVVSAPAAQVTVGKKGGVCLPAACSSAANGWPPATCSGACRCSTPSAEPDLPAAAAGACWIHAPCRAAIAGRALAGYCPRAPTALVAPPRSPSPRCLRCPSAPCLQRLLLLRLLRLHNHLQPLLHADPRQPEVGQEGLLVAGWARLNTCHMHYHWLPSPP